MRREAERIAYQENLLNRIVFDAYDPAPGKEVDPNKVDEVLPDALTQAQEGISPSLPTRENCDND